MQKNEKNMKKWKNEKNGNMKKKWKNEKKWKKKTEKNMKQCKKMKKMKKWKNGKKWKMKKKNEKNREKWWKKTEKWKKMGSHAKSSTISRVYRCCCNFFRQNPRRLPWFCFGMCLFPKENQQPVLGVIVFQKKSDNFHWTWNKNTHFTDENEQKKIAKVSPSNNNYSFRIIKSFNTIWGGSVLTGEEPPPHSGELKHALPQAGGPTQSQLSYVVRTPHLPGAPTTEETVKLWYWRQQ